MTTKLTSFESFLCAADEVHTLDVERIDNNSMRVFCTKCRFEQILTNQYLEDILDAGQI